MQDSTFSPSSYYLEKANSFGDGQAKKVWYSVIAPLEGWEGGIVEMHDGSILQFICPLRGTSERLDFRAAEQHLSYRMPALAHRYRYHPDLYEHEHEHELLLRDDTQDAAKAGN